MEGRSPASAYRRTAPAPRWGFRSTGRTWLPWWRRRSALHRTTGRNMPSCRLHPRPSRRSDRRCPSQSRRPRLRRPSFPLLPPLLLPPAFPLPSSPPQPPSPLFPHKAPRSPRHQSWNRSTRTPAVRSCPQSGAVRYRRGIDNLLPVLPSQIPRFLCRRCRCRGVTAAAPEAMWWIN